MSIINDKKAFDAQLRSVQHALEFYDYDNKDAIITKVICIKRERTRRCTSAKEILWRAIRALGFSRQRYRLLDNALSNSGVLSDLEKYTESYVARLQPPSEIRKTHSILSATEEVYSVEVHSQKRQSILLKLQMSLCNGGLSVRATAPRHLWLSIFLQENYSSLSRYQILDS